MKYPIAAVTVSRPGSILGHCFKLLDKEQITCHLGKYLDCTYDVSVIIGLT